MPDDPRGLPPVLSPPSDLNPRREAPLDFPDREWGELGEADYHALGFLSGLEVHQQLATATKLFCRCPSGVYTERYDAEVLRHMRPTLSELGEYDGTALMEFKTRKDIIYLLERGSVCTYEIDDTPPFEINEEAVRVALEIAELFDLDPVQELHVMRKQYLDGSIPTGFQRTAMIGLGGRVPFRVPALGVDRDLHIRQLSLEEDSCREVRDVGHQIVFRTDRLGIPLTEVVTEPELLSPLELQAAARLVAQTTRACPRTRRGPGAARQDVNVSIAGGRRTEIKGVPHHRGLPRLVHNEAMRQLNLLRIAAELGRRGVRAEMLQLPEGGLAWEVSPLAIDATSTLRQSDFAPIQDALDAGGRVTALRLPGFRSLLAHRTQPHIPFASEIADRVRVIACLTGRPFLIHSDLAGYGLSSAQWTSLRKALRADKGDTLVVLWGPERDLDTAVREVFSRALDALTGVPSETRQAFADGTTGFERILPGPNRMYPDTDTPPMPIPDAWIETIRAKRPERPFEREDRYVELGLPRERAQRLAIAPWADLFDALVGGIEADASGVAGALEEALQKRLPRFLRASRGSSLPPAERLLPWARALSRGELAVQAAEIALDRLLVEPLLSADEILVSLRPHADDPRALEDLLERVRTQRSEVRRTEPEAVLRWAMGQIMPSLVGRLPAQEIRRQIIRSLHLPIEAEERP